MIYCIWLGYLLMSLWTIIMNAADIPSSSVSLSHRKLALRSISYVIAPSKGEGEECDCHRVNSFNTFGMHDSPSSVPAHWYSSETPSEPPILYRRRLLTTYALISRGPSSSSTYTRKTKFPASNFLSSLSFFASPPSVFSSMALDSPPPVPPHLNGCCQHNMVLRPGSLNCSCAYPIMINLRILNVSTSSTDWAKEFLLELASQLHLNANQFTIASFYIEGVNQLNITMDIVPTSGTSFSFQEASRINYTLASYRVHLNSSLFGGYQLQNFTWVEPPAFPPAIPVPSPVASSEGLSPTPGNGGVHVPHGNKKVHNVVVILSTAVAILIVIIVAVFMFWKFTMHEEKKPEKLLKHTASTARTISSEGLTPRPRSTRFFSFEELKEATNNFESVSMLGEGGFGRVFKGVLKDGTSVAIKKLSSGGHQGDKEFLVEVDMLSRLHHRNLVKLVGYYSSRDSSQHLLCYELVPNGSLEAWLHGPLGANHPLDWDTRMKIALDSARGLAYLHEDSQPCVIHRDFKASNILLENNFHAKVADFGLAKHAPEGRGNYLSTRVMGTFGYVAPEYAMTGHLLVKSDVYSYGVVLLELLTGRRPVDMSRPSGQENLVTWARPILRDKDRVDDLADPRLGGKYPREDFLQVCAIAAACVAPEASQRPTMGEVVQSLKMVQRSSDYHQSGEKEGSTGNLTSSSRLPTASGHVGPSSTTFESDGSSTFFSSGPCSGLSGIDNEHHPRTGVFSEDLQEGR